MPEECARILEELDYWREEYYDDPMCLRLIDKFVELVEDVYEDACVRF